MNSRKGAMTQRGVMPRADFPNGALDFTRHSAGAIQSNGGRGSVRGCDAPSQSVSAAPPPQQVRSTGQCAIPAQRRGVAGTICDGASQPRYLRRVLHQSRTP